MKIRIGDREIEATQALADGLVPLVWKETPRGAFFIVSLRGRILDGHAAATDEGWRIWLGGETVEVARCHDMPEAGASRAAGTGPIKAPCACRLLAILVEEGQDVDEGTPLARLESMKMEQDILAPCPARVASVVGKPGSTVARGQTLLTLEEK